jgi:hypothetical protein
MNAEAAAGGAVAAVRPGIRPPGWLAPAAAGVIAGAGLFDLLPTAAGSLGARSTLWAGAGIVAMLLATKLASVHQRWVGWAAGVGIAMHSALEGVAAAAGYGAGPGTGILTSLGLAAHLVPESLALFAIFTATGVSARRAVLGCCLPWALLIGGFAASQHVLTGSDALLSGTPMAFGAGAFIGLACLILFLHSGSILRNLAVCSVAAIWVAGQHLF